MTVRILITGFEPFGDRPRNPSADVLPLVAAAVPPDVELTTDVLPVSYHRAFGAVERRLREAAPPFDAVIHLGLGSGRAAVSFETQAVNDRGSEGPDEDGVSVAQGAIDGAGPESRAATLPIPSLVDACSAAGVPAESSDDAGRFLCNQVLYQSLGLATELGIGTRVGFVHLPDVPELAPLGGPSMQLDRMADGLAAVIARIARLVRSERSEPV